MQKGVSIIICCYNSATLLKPTLQHIALQKLDGQLNCEVIIVDNASTDGTADVAKNEWAALHQSDIKLTIVTESTPGLINARKKGVEIAMYDYLIFCDDDNWLSENYVTTAYNYFELHPGVAIIGGHGYPVFENKQLVPPWFKKFTSSFALGAQSTDPDSLVTTVYGAGMCVKKTLLMANKYQQLPSYLTGRHGKLLTAGDDSEICYQANLFGYKVAYLQALEFKHYLPAQRLNWQYLRKLHAGFASSYVIINLYQRALETGAKPLPAFYWLKQAGYFAGIYLKYWLKHYKAYYKNEGTDEELHHITWKIIAADYFKYNFKISGIYRSIIAAKTSN